MFCIILIAVLVFMFLILWNLKIPKCGAMSLITGGVKTGKSAMSVWCARKTYVGNLIKYYIKTYFQYLRPKSKRVVFEHPHLYSNVPLRCNYVPLTLELIKRQERFTYGSVIYVNEASLLACSMDIRNMELNDRLMLFNKLIGHETRGGSLFYDTQSIGDNHYSVKRCLESYFYIHHNVKIPFVCLILYVREMKYSDDNNSVNVINTDLEDDLKRCIIPWRYLKLYDRYCFSILTDHLPVNENVVKRSKSDKRNKKLDLKARNIISFKDWSKYL